MTDAKSELRRHFLELRTKAPHGSREIKAIHDSLFGSEYFKNAETIFTYLSTDNEIDTKEIVLRAFRENKRVALPHVRNRPQMDFLLIDDLYNLERSRFGILEPVFNRDKIIESDQTTLIIVPGLVFDTKKFRIGYGGGYYDYFLSRSVFLKSIGLCYSTQVIDNVPACPYDRPVDIIITEKEMIL